MDLTFSFKFLMAQKGSLTANTPLELHPNPIAAQYLYEVAFEKTKSWNKLDSNIPGYSLKYLTYTFWILRNLHEAANKVFPVIVFSKIL